MKNNGTRLYLFFSLCLVVIVFSQMALAQKTVQRIDPICYQTVDNYPNLLSATTVPDTGGIYYETPPNAGLAGQTDGWYTNSPSAASWGGSHRRSPNTAGSPSGATANYRFSPDTTGYYLIYIYLQNSGNASENPYLTVKRFGEGNFADSLRFNQKIPGFYTPTLIARGFIDTIASTADGSWMPITAVTLSSGKNSATITQGADTLTPSFMRIDAVRILRSRYPKDLEFGSRARISFDSLRIPEVFPQTSLGEVVTKNYKFWNLGSQPVTISKIYGKTGRFSTSTTLPLAIPAQSYKIVGIDFRPYQEEETVDTLTIECDDSQEPIIKWITIGEGINYNFILNASAGGAEPMWNVPGTPSSKYPEYPAPLYIEIPSGWINSTASSYVYPIPGGNRYSRVYTPDGASECLFKFFVPPDKSGSYLLEYGGPVGSANAHRSTTVEVVTPFVTDTQRVTGYNSRISSVFGQDSRVGAGFAYQFNGGDTSTIRWSAVNGGGDLIRMDLLRVRKIPSKPTITMEFTAIDFGSISTIDSVRAASQGYRRTAKLRSNGEQTLVLRDVHVAVGKYFKLVNGPAPNAEVPAVNGVYTLTMEFTPDSIRTGYRDTVVVLSNTYPDSLHYIILNGNGIGTEAIVDNSDSLSVYIYPQPIVAFDTTNNPNLQNKWQRYAGSGQKGDRLLARIYKVPEAVVEWFPNLPLLGKPIGTKDSFYVAIVTPSSSVNSTPRARYIVYAADAAPDTFIVSQNLVTGGEIVLSRDGVRKKFAFRRGGKDSHGTVPALYGYVRLENDTALVSKYYIDSSKTNEARDSGYYLRADAVMFREAAITYIAEREGDIVPNIYELSQNYPNPFNPVTEIRFAIPERNDVNLIVYDILGREVTRLISGEVKDAGVYKVQWDSRNSFGQTVSSGVYIYRLTSGSFVSTKKMMLIK